jgi:hypothetical protein
MTNPWYDKECKIVRKVIRDPSNESLKFYKINRYKYLIKRKKNYRNRKQEKLLQLSKLDTDKFWRQILARKTKENNMISLKDWNSYLQYLYESPDVMDNIQTLSTEE